MDNYTTLPGMLFNVLRNCPNSYALNHKQGGHWESLSTEKFLEMIRQFTLGLKAIGLEKGQGFGIIANSSPHWVAMDQAISINGAVTVPMFPNISPDNFEFQVSDSNTRYLFIQDGDILDERIRKRLGRFKKVITISDKDEGSNIIQLSEIFKLGDDLSKKNPSLYSELLKNINEMDLATIIYTSGSTGKPRGVQLCHRNLISQIKGARIRFPADPSKEKMLTCLPLAHAFERMVIYYYISTGASIYFADDIKKIGGLIKEIQPTIMTLVPRILEKVYTKMLAGVQEKTGLTRKIAQMAINSANRHDHDNYNGMTRKIFDKLIFSKLRNALGGRFRYLISGGSPLSPDLARFFLNIGLPLYNGYGLTESSPVLTANYPGHNKTGTVGLPFPEVDIKISDTNEILAKGPNIMMGYHNNPKATKEVIDSEGWLHTGDMGKLDEDGFLIITGRLKEFFKTSTGKYVSPLPLEQSLAQHDLVDMAMILAEGKKFVSALIFPDFENLSTLQRLRGMEGLSDEEFFNSKKVIAELDELVDKINSKQNKWEQIVKYRVIIQQISTSTDEVTPTMKIRRHIIEDKFSKLINDMYQ